MHRVLSGGILSAVIAFGFAAGANAQEVLRSGNTYHTAVCGAASVGFARCHARIVTDVAGNAIQHDSSRISGYGPADLQSAYKITGSGSSSTIMAVVDAFGYDNAESDLGTYRSNFGLPACTTANGCFEKLNQSGQQSGYPSQNISWAQESALDLDMASAMCPNCKIWLVEANDNGNSNLATAVNTAATLGAHVVSNSYGGSESGSQSFESKYNQPGVAVTASTGDHGFAAGPQFPATSPHVIAVGGTHLVTDGSQRGWNETVWSGAGSGCSTVYSKPSWQKDPTCTKRMEADTSADADPATGCRGVRTELAGHWRLAQVRRHERRGSSCRWRVCQQRQESEELREDAL
ncbi:MAG: hypothetical protein WDM89_22490 [Rhizomicrobium sp.]